MMHKGFSLVELSIVLVILGLLTGGILAGQSLIRAAEIRSISSDYSRYLVATHTFRDKYRAIPGDMNNATRFWGRATATADCITNSSAAVASPGSCDGSGDGILNAPGAASESGEDYQFWKQLALAGLIEGSFTGTAGTGGTLHSVVGTNVPTTKIATVGFTPYYRGTGSDPEPGVTIGNHFRIGVQSTTQATALPFLKPEEMWNMDTKIDDGKPMTGMLLVRNYNNCTTAASNTDLTGAYALTNSSIDCMMLGKFGF